MFDRSVPARALTSSPHRVAAMAGSTFPDAYSTRALRDSSREGIRPVNRGTYLGVRPALVPE